MSLKLVVDNTNSAKHKVLKNLMSHDGKPVNTFCALRDIPNTKEAWDGLLGLIDDGLVERQEFLMEGNQVFFLYRYKAELALFRKAAQTA